MFTPITHSLLLPSKMYIEYSTKLRFAIMRLVCLVNVIIKVLNCNVLIRYQYWAENFVYRNEYQEEGKWLETEARDQVLERKRDR